MAPLKNEQLWENFKTLNVILNAVKDLELVLSPLRRFFAYTQNDGRFVLQMHNKRIVDFAGFSIVMILTGGLLAINKGYLLMTVVLFTLILLTGYGVLKRVTPLYGVVVPFNFPNYHLRTVHGKTAVIMNCAFMILWFFLIYIFSHKNISTSDIFLTIVLAIILSATTVKVYHPR